MTDSSTAARDDPPAEGGERAFERPGQLGRDRELERPPVHIGQAAELDACRPGELVEPDRYGARPEVPVGADAEKALLTDELRRDVDPGGLAAQGHRDRTLVAALAPALDPSLDATAAPGLGAVEHDREVRGRLRRRVSPSNEVVGDVCQEHSSLPEGPGRPLGRPGRSVSSPEATPPRERTCRRPRSASAPRFDR